MKGMDFYAPLLAFVIYGGWAGFVNSEYGAVVFLKAGLGQGVYALFSTWIVTVTARRVYTAVGGNRRGLIAGFSGGFTLMLIIPLSIHFVIGTPDVLEAIAPGLAWGSLYVIFVLRVTHNQHRKSSSGIHTVTTR